jgi:hypothetical protein
MIDEGMCGKITTALPMRLHESKFAITLSLPEICSTLQLKSHVATSAKYFWPLLVISYLTPLIFEIPTPPPHFHSIF